MWMAAKATQPVQNEWTLTAPDGTRFTGPSPGKTALKASHYHAETDPAAAKRLADAIETIRKEGEAEHDRCIREYGTLDCPACGGSGHIGDVKAVPEYYQWRRKADSWSLDHIYRHEVKATTDDSEVRKLYAYQVQVGPQTSLVPWTDSQKQVPPADLEMVFVCYVGVPDIEDGEREITRAEYVRGSPQQYPLWMPLPAAPKVA